VRKVLIITCVVLLAAGLSLVVLEKTHIINLYSKNSDQSSINSAKTTSKAKSAQDSFTDGSDRNLQQTDKNEGTVTDNRGDISEIPPTDKWTRSTSGIITLYTPERNGLIQNGSILSGESSVPQVSFRLIDDVSGMISQGQLNVVNGKFSGTFNFQTSGKIGRLDIYNKKPDGSETNNIEQPVRFN
jgi:hypothetical protein